MDTDGDTAALKQWLAGRMARHLQQSAIQLSQNEYTVARQAVGSDYQDYLEQYVDVATTTDDTADDQVGQTLTRTQSQQREFINQTQRFNNLYAELRAASAAGNEQRARRLARQLNRTGTRAQQTGTNLTQSYATLETETEVNLSTATTTVTARTENISTVRQQTIRDLFVETRLTITATNATGSFTDPTTLSGTLAVPGNASLPEEARLQIGSATQTVDLTPNGSFTATYRPVTVPTGTQTLRVRYRPVNTSIYLPATQSVTITIKNVTPAVAIETAPATIQYGEPVRVTGRITAAEEPVPRVPVRIRVGTIVLARTHTNATGHYTVRPRLPAQVPPGTRSVTVTAGNTTQAIAQASRTQPIEVAETPVSLSLTATKRGETLNVSGTLTTARGRPLPNQRVAIRHNGSLITSVQTGPNGTYQTSIPVAGMQSMTVQAVFDGAGTNLGDDRASTTVPLGPADGQNSWFAGMSAWLIGLSLGGVALLLVLGVWLRRRSSPDSGDGVAVSDSGGASAHGSAAAIPRDDSSLDDRLEAVLTSTSSPDEIAIATFAELRRALTASADVTTGATHWEFYDAISDYDQSLATPLEDIVSAYEQAVYAPGSLSAAQAEQVVERAKTIAASQ